MKVMFLGGGRRNSLARRFREHGYDVLAYELSTNVPVSLEADVVSGYKWSNQDVSLDIQRFYETKHCDLVIPLADEATKIVSRMNVNCPTSDTEVNELFLDKKYFEHLCEEPGLREFYPFVYKNEFSIKKPRFGFNSKGVSKVVEPDDEPGFVYQRYIEGPEFSADCYFSRDGRLVDGIVRERLVVQGGEVSQSCTLSRLSWVYQQAMHFIRTLGSLRQLKGPFCIQFRSDGERLYVIEVNARFGGGVILSLEAGFDIIDLITTEYITTPNGVPFLYESTWKEGLSMSRYFQEFFYEVRD